MHHDAEWAAADEAVARLATLYRIVRGHAPHAEDEAIESFRGAIHELAAAVDTAVGDQEPPTPPANDVSR